MNSRQLERRSYWTARMDEADTFMQKIMTYPVDECLEPMDSMVDAARSAGLKVTFSDQPHVEGLPRLYYLRRSLINSFLAAARELNNRGWILKVEDAYRTQAMQRGLSRLPAVFKTVLEKTAWECGESSPPAELLFRRLGALVALAPKVGTHLSGSAMDVSVLWQDSETEVDRGSPYLEMSERTPMSTPYISAEAQANRREITAIMYRHGFYSYPWEFWHYNAGDAYAELLSRSGKPARYGAVQLDQASGFVTPIPEPTRFLNSTADFRLMLEQAMRNPINAE